VSSIVFLSPIIYAKGSVDAVTSATNTMSNLNEGEYNTSSKILIVLFSSEK
jgi:hypothetical protein